MAPSADVTGWAQRSSAQAAMLNPALLAAVAAAAALEYERAGGDPMPWPLAFLVAPLVLHRGTRAALPRTTRTHWASWVSEHPVEHAGFPARAQALTSLIREGIRFGLAHGALVVDEQGRLTGHLGPVPRKGTELADIIAKAGLVGKWLTKLDQPATAFALLGVRP